MLRRKALEAYKDREYLRAVYEKAQQPMERFETDFGIKPHGFDCELVLVDDLCFRYVSNERRWELRIDCSECGQIHFCNVGTSENDDLFIELGYLLVLIGNENIHSEGLVG